jgi:hypothetical protein
LGLILGFLYDVFYLLNTKVKKRWFLFLADIVFSLIFTVLFFCFLIGFNGGEFRAVFLIDCLAALCLNLAILRKIQRVFNKLLKDGQKL